MLFCFALVVAVITVYLCIVFPVWMIWECASSYEFTPLKKTFLLVFQLLFWAIGSYIYALLYSDKKFSGICGFLLLGAALWYKSKHGT